MLREEAVEAEILDIQEDFDGCYITSGPKWIDVLRKEAVEAEILDIQEDFNGCYITSASGMAIC